MTEETEALRFNTGIAAMMEFVNGALKWPGPPPAAVLEPFLLLLAPYAPHLAEEMWQVGQVYLMSGRGFAARVGAAKSVKRSRRAATVHATQRHALADPHRQVHCATAKRLPSLSVHRLLVAPHATCER